MTKNPRVLLYPLAALAVVVVLVVLRPERPGAAVASMDAADAPAAPAVEPAPAGYAPLRPTHYPQPPGDVMRRPIPADPVERWADRIVWAPNEIVDKTKAQLGRLDATQRRRFVDRAEAIFRENPNVGARFLTGIAPFDDPDAHALVFEAATHSSNYVRGEAARALSLMDGELAAKFAGELLRDPAEAVRRSAVVSLTGMRSEAALDLLREHAARAPREAAHHVVLRLAQEKEDPAVIPLLREYVDAEFELSYVALGALAGFGDLLALDLLGERLASPDYFHRLRALSALEQAPPELVPLEVVEPAVDDRAPDVRALAIGLVARIGEAAEEPTVRERAMAVLERKRTDQDLRSRQTALAGLYALGRRDVSEPFLRAIAVESGRTLYNAVDVAGHLLRDPRAAAAILARLASGPLSGDDHATLLAGLGAIGAPEGIDAFLDAIRAAGPDEPRESSGISVSATAALHLPRLGPAAAERLVALLGEEGLSEHGRRRALDALRGFPWLVDAVEPVLRIAVDPKQPEAVRLDALDTLAHFQQAEVFGPLAAARDRFETLALGRRVRLVLLVYA